MDVLGVVQETIEREHLLERKAKIVLGVSGGPDSLCLLHLFTRLQAQYDWSLHVAHLHHGLRGAAADEDMVFVALQAIEWGLSCTIQVIDVAAVAQARGLSIEEAARQVRYGFLSQVAQEIGATAVAVGHHADDQSETVLMHFLRGSGLSGLRGMSPVVDLGNMRLIRNHAAAAPHPHIPLVRPLLAVPRAAIQAYCRDHHLSPRIDQSNRDVTYFRNRLRHELLPLLETYNPNIRALLRRTASVAKADYALIATARDTAWTRLVQAADARAITFELKGWRALPLALRRATLRQAAYRLRPHLRDIDFVHVKAAVDVATHGTTGAQATLPQGLCLTVGYDTLHIADTGTVPLPPDQPLLWQADPTPVSLPGQTTLPRTAAPSLSPQPLWQLEAQMWSGDRRAIWSNPNRWTAYLDADQLGPHPALRPRRAGDRFQPLGMGGKSVSLADFMINVKLPSQWRDHTPLLVHQQPDGEQDQIAWVVGWRIDERAQVMQDTQHIVRLRWHKVPEESM